MKRNHLIALLITFAMLFVSGVAFAASATANLTINATVSATAKLTFGSTTMTFTNQDPDTTPAIAASENAVSVTAKVRTGAASLATLTVLTGGDLTSGTNTIAISNVTWTASGTGFVPGTMNKTTAQSVGSWTGSGVRNGTLSFSLANSWSYATGSYAATSTFTLTAP